jgi:hypothetical protein
MDRSFESNSFQTPLPVASWSCYRGLFLCFFAFLLDMALPLFKVALLSGVYVWFSMFVAPPEASKSAVLKISHFLVLLLLWSFQTCVNMRYFTGTSTAVWCFTMLSLQFYSCFPLTAFRHTGFPPCEFLSRANVAAEGRNV